MVKLQYQNDEKWRDRKFADTSKTIGSIGCLLTGSSNVKNLHSKDIVMNPILLHTELYKNKGFTKDGLIIWSVLEKILNCKIEPYYKGYVDYDVNCFYVVHYYMLDREGKRHGHFTNMLEFSDFKYFCFDVWDGLNKIKKSNEIDRIVKYIF